MNIVLPF